MPRIKLGNIKGPKGDRGDTGPKGADGKSAYQSWLDLGNTGTERQFIDSLKPSTDQFITKAKYEADLTALKEAVDKLNQ